MLIRLISALYLFPWGESESSFYFFIVTFHSYHFVRNWKSSSWLVARSKSTRVRLWGSLCHHDFEGLFAIIDLDGNGPLDFVEITSFMGQISGQIDLVKHGASFMASFVGAIGGQHGNLSEDEDAVEAQMIDLSNNVSQVWT